MRAISGIAAVRLCDRDSSLEHEPDLLVLNKFGKVECEGGGLRDLIASAIDRGIPVMIGVPRRNLEAWRRFAGDFAVESYADDVSVQNWLMEVSQAAEQPGVPGL